MNNISLFEHLPATQRQLLQACVRAGELRRTRDGYVGHEVGVYFNTRTVMAMERAGYVQLSDGTASVEPTEAGRALMDQARLEPKQRSRAA